MILPCSQSPVSVSRLASRQKALDLLAQSANAMDEVDIRRRSLEDHDDDDDIPNSSSSSCTITIFSTRFILRLL